MKSLDYFQMDFLESFLGTCEKEILEKKASRDMEDYANTILEEGTQFVQWSSPKKTNSWICKEKKKARYIDRLAKQFR